MGTVNKDTEKNILHKKPYLILFIIEGLKSLFVRGLLFGDLYPEDICPEGFCPRPLSNTLKLFGFPISSVPDEGYRAYLMKVIERT
jgi:hypothetical protein